jgi:hypothetical protein
MVEKIEQLILSNGYYDLEWNGTYDNEHNYIAMLDGLLEVQVRVDGDQIRIYDRYPEDKNYSFVLETVL